MNMVAEHAVEPCALVGAPGSGQDWTRAAASTRVRGLRPGSPATCRSGAPACMTCVLRLLPAIPGQGAPGGMPGRLARLAGFDACIDSQIAQPL